MAQADEFTMPMAQAITGAAETQDLLLAALTAENAFVTQLPDGETYRFHHMLRDRASQAFSRLPQARQRTYLAPLTARGTKRGASICTPWRHTAAAEILIGCSASWKRTRGFCWRLSGRRRF